MVKKILFGATIALFVLSAQQPTCNKCNASYISSDEVESYLKRAKDNGLVDQQTRAGGADFSLAVEDRIERSAPSRLEIGVREDDVRRFSAQLQNRGNMVGGSGLTDQGADRRRPRKRQMIDAGMISERRSGLVWRGMVNVK